ncbi:hypothetical protein H072_2199 [Dactylellina haptotyla CBS 200.50]|uniref:NDT80 domain-containing protein n=1 Tax=Dactylellina haptotyla (strain CBS 200.50) TaxID=1284197 RepID=S8ALJ2_DACHA|nr:hypothetical protein H072_2199 [Dactylellina haptotyla CBS 200.50]
MPDLDERGSTKASSTAPGSELPGAIASASGISNLVIGGGGESEKLTAISKSIDGASTSEAVKISSIAPGEPREALAPSITPGQPLTDHPPPSLIEKISLTDETTTPPSSGQLHEERPSLTSKETQIPVPSKQDHLTSGVTKAANPAFPAALPSDTKNPEPETVSIHGKSRTSTSPSSSSASHAGIVSNTSLPALSQIVMPFGLTNDAGRPLSPAAGTQMDPTVSRSMGLPASPSFTRSDISHLDNLHHRPSVDHSTLSTLPTLPAITTRHRSSRSPSGARSPPLSDSSDGSIHLLPPLAMDSSSATGHQAAGPPLHETEVLQKIVTPDGHIIRPEIHARIDKGFFLSDNDWTCYRRNYFSVGCSYSLYPQPSGAIYIQTHLGMEHINSFAVKISAAVEGAGGKPVELVQHTPKRDKGPQMQPGFIKLVPQTASTQFGGPQAMLKDYEYNYTHSHLPHQQLNQAVFDRIQFKSATANNGKRRAAQQYYHLVVELFAEIISSGESDPTFVLVAKRISAPMVVRGRSPGHYVDERKHNRPTSAGPDGKGSGTQPSTPATAYAPGSGLASDHHHQYYAKATLPGASSEHDHYVHMPTEGEPASYAYYPQALNHPYDTRQSNHTSFNGYYVSGGVHDTFKGYQPMGISCSTYGDSTYGYIPSIGRSRVKNETIYNNLSWPRDTPRVEYQRNHITDKLYSTESSSQHYPSLPTL